MEDDTKDLCNECVNNICCALKNLNNKLFSKIRCYKYFQKVTEINEEIERTKRELQNGGKISAKELGLRLECIVGYEPQDVSFVNGKLLINFGFGDKKYDVGEFKERH